MYMTRPSLTALTTLMMTTNDDEELKYFHRATFLPNNINRAFVRFTYRNILQFVKHIYFSVSQHEQ